MAITLWHNPRCSKSREAVTLFEDKKTSIEIRLYLQDAPTIGEIETLLSQLDISPRDLMRKGEAVYKELGLKDETSDKALIKAMSDNPILIERPIGIANGTAIVGRPPENLLALLK